MRYIIEHKKYKKGLPRNGIIKKRQVFDSQETAMNHMMVNILNTDYREKVDSYCVYEENNKLYYNYCNTERKLLFEENSKNVPHTIKELNIFMTDCNRLKFEQDS